MKRVFGIAIGTIALVMAIGVAAVRDAAAAGHGSAGEYRGSALNTTVSQRGDVVLDLFAVDPRSGHLRAYFAASNGLAGDAWLSGTLASDGDLELSGPLASFAMTVRGRVRGDSIDASYRLDGRNAQKGTFRVEYRNALPFAQDATMQRLIGAWEVGGGMAAPTDPITGEAAGMSFVDARHLDILPSGRFKHLRSHRNCMGRGAARCCPRRGVPRGGAARAPREPHHLRRSGGTDDRHRPLRRRRRPADSRAEAKEQFRLDDQGQSDRNTHALPPARLRRTGLLREAGLIR